MEPKIFQNLTNNQRKSIVNFHTTISLSDGPINNQEGGILSKLCDLCGVLVNDCVEYFVYEGGQEQLLKDLKTISGSEKDILIVSIWGLIICDGKPNERELSVTYFLFEKIGITEDRFLKVIEKNRQVRNYFNS